MAITYTDNGGGAPNGSDLEFTYTFPVLKTEDVKVALNAVVQATTKYTVDNVSNPTKITFNNTSVDSLLQESTGAPKAGVTVRVFRQTTVGKTSGDDDPKAVFAAGSSIRAADLNANQEQALYAIHELQDQPLTDQDIEDGAITSSKISPDFGSQNIATTGTVDGRDVSVDGTKLDTIETNATADQTDAEIKTAYENNANTNAFTDTQNTFVNAITATATEINTLDGITATTAELNQAAGITSGIQAQIDSKQPLDSELTELATMGSGTAGALADLNTAEVQTLDGITASTAELNLLDGKSIVTTIGGSATDTQLPSAQAVNERIVELVTEVGGFTPIANETSFPATNPDINDGAGTIVSVKALAANLVANGSGVATITNGAGTGNTVTINGLGNSQTIPAGKGLLVETTTTLHTYTFHRESIDSTDVSNAQTLVNDFNDRYQISNTPPSSHPDGSALQDGDLWFDTSANIMKVYDLGNTQYDAVTSVGDFKLLTVVPDGATSGSPTFDGNIVSYDLRDGTNAAAITSVGQLLVSLNGVIQKPNAGTYNASNEGFYLEGTDGIKFCTAPPSGSNLFITLIGAATAIGTPSDNTVDENKLTTDSVSEAKLKVSNSPVNGYFLSAQSGNTGGLTWAAVNTELEQDGSPSLSANLDLSGYSIITNATNGSIQLVPNGTGNVKIAGAGGNDGTLQLNCSANSHGVKIKSPPHSAAASYTLTLPNNIVNGQFLKTDSSGNLSWAAVDLTALSASNLTSGTIPDARFPSTLPALDGSNLTGLASTVADGCVYENSQTISNNYTVGTNKNAFSAGPITIASGATVTVPSGSTYTIV